MNEEISSAAEQLPEYRQHLIAMCAEFVDVKSSQVLNDYVTSEVRRFASQLKTEFPDISFKQVLEYQTLIGGSETTEFDGEVDRLREVLERIEHFVEVGLQVKRELLK